MLMEERKLSVLTLYICLVILGVPLFSLDSWLREVDSKIFSCKTPKVSTRFQQISGCFVVFDPQVSLE